MCHEKQTTLFIGLTRIKRQYLPISPNISQYFTISPCCPSNPSMFAQQCFASINITEKNLLVQSFYVQWRSLISLHLEHILVPVCTRQGLVHMLTGRGLGQLLLFGTRVFNGTTGQKSIHCPGTKGQWDKLLPRDGPDRDFDSLSRSVPEYPGTATGQKGTRVKKCTIFEKKN